MARFLPLLLIAACGASSLRLETLPDDVDPGASEPLLANAPLSLRRALMEVEDSATRGLLDEALREGRTLGAQELIVAMFVMEARSDQACDTRCLSHLELVYRLLSLLGDTGFQDTLAWFEPWMARFQDAESVEAQQSMAFLREIFERAPERHDWAAARLLRADVDAHVHGEVVLGLAQRARSGGDLERARNLFGLAIPLLGDHARVADVSGLARACYAVLDFACGDAAAARLGAMPNAAEDVRRVDTMRDAARLVRGSARGLDARLARADALVTLHRDAEATALYRDLAYDHPDDARPHVGLAHLVFARHGGRLVSPTEAGFEAHEKMRGHLQAAGGLSNRGERYYGLSMLGWNFRVLWTVTRRVLANAEQGVEGPALDPASLRAFREELHAFTDDFRRFDGGTATAFRALGDFQLAVLSRPTSVPDANGHTNEPSTAELVAPSLGAVRAQLDSSPNNVATYRVAILIAMLTEDEAFVTRALAGLPPATDDDEPTARARSRASLLVGLRSRDPNVPRDGSGDAETDALVRWARTAVPTANTAVPTTNTADADAAAELERLVASAPPESRARVLNNAAVARHRVGDGAAARALLEQAQHEEGWDVLRYNTLALLPEAERDAQWAERLSQLTEPTARSAVRLQAARLHSHHAGTLHPRLAEAREAVRRDRMPEQAAFVESYQVGLGYTSEKGITTSGTTPLPWLLLEAPRPPRDVGVRPLAPRTPPTFE